MRADIGMLQRPKAVLPIVDRARSYVAAMTAAKRPVLSVTISPAHYDTIVRSLNSGRERADLVDSLHLNGIPVVRGGQSTEGQAAA